MNLARKAGGALMNTKNTMESGLELEKLSNDLLEFLLDREHSSPKGILCLQLACVKLSLLGGKGLKDLQDSFNALWEVTSPFYEKCIKEDERLRSLLQGKGQNGRE